MPSTEAMAGESGGIRTPPSHTMPSPLGFWAAVATPSHGSLSRRPTAVRRLCPPLLFPPSRSPPTPWNPVTTRCRDRRASRSNPKRIYSFLPFPSRDGSPPPHNGAAMPAPATVHLLLPTAMDPGPPPCRRGLQWIPDLRHHESRISSTPRLTLSRLLRTHSSLSR
jgi:hypothetical protein